MCGWKPSWVLLVALLVLLLSISRGAEPPDVAQPCDRDLDLVIVLSNSEFEEFPEPDRTKLKDFISNLAAAFKTRPTSRVAFVTYLYEAKLIFGLGQNLTPEELKIKISGPGREFNPVAREPITNGLDITNLALRELENNGRAGIPRKIVQFAVPTEGNQSRIGIDPKKATFELSQAVKFATAAVEKGVSSFSVGLYTSEEDQKFQADLLAMTGNVSENVFTSKEVRDIGQKLRQMSTRICMG